MPDEPPPLSPSRGPSRATVAVSLGIGLVLLGLILPALMKAREASNRLSCRGNLKGIAIAAQSYHNDYSRLPPGYVGPLANETAADPSNGPHVGFIAYLLPYLAQRPSPVADLVSLERKDQKTEERVQPAWWTDAARFEAGRLQVPLLRCPSAPLPDEDAHFVVALHHFNTKDQLRPEEHMTAWTVPGGRGLGTTNYVGVSGALGRGTGNSTVHGQYEWNHFQGVLGNRTALTFGRLTANDGTSNTLLIGESLGGYENGRLKFAHTWMGSGGMGVAGGLGGKDDEPSLHHFSSAHPGVVLFAFADGSVQSFRRNPPTLLKRLPESVWRDGFASWPSQLRELFCLAGYRDGINP